MLVPGILKEFCQNTSIHGLKSIVDAKSSLIKRIAWFVIFVISILYAGVQLKGNVDSKLTLSMWQKIMQIRLLKTFPIALLNNTGQFVKFHFNQKLTRMEIHKH